MSDLGLIDAVKNGEYAAAEMLLKSGTDVNQQDEQGWTPLNFAAGRGDLSLVQLLIDNGADIFKVGRDRRTPYAIALAAGRISVAKYLREVEDNFPGQKPVPPPRQYCKAYYLKDLRSFPSWSESRINWKEKKENGDSNGADGFSVDKVVYIHQDLTVTESIWPDENIIFQSGDTDWKSFCTDHLKFKVPDDFDLSVPNEIEG
jgi:hypothetical protein